MDNEEEIYEDQDNAELEITNSNNIKAGRKKLFGGLVGNFIFTRSYFKRFSDKTTCLLTDKGFKHVLTGESDNDPIEYHFSLNRCLGGHHLALDISTFAHNERALLLNLIIKLRRNNGSHNKILFK